MAGYCVILSGRLPGDKDDASVWTPVIAAFKLDEASFAQHVLAALPLIVRQNLDEAAAEGIAQKLRSGGVDACIQPDDAQLVYFERAGTIRGPLPYSALSLFILSGERYRMRNSQEWASWTDARPDVDPPLPKLFAGAAADLPEEEIPPPLPSEDEPPPPPFLTTAPARPSVTVAQALAVSEDVPPPLPSQDEPPLPPFLATASGLPSVAEDVPPPLPSQQDEPLSPPLAVAQTPPKSEMVPPTFTNNSELPSIEQIAPTAHPLEDVEPLTSPAHQSGPTEFAHENDAGPARSYKKWGISCLVLAFLVAAGSLAWLYVNHRNASSTAYAGSTTAQPIQAPAGVSPSAIPAAKRTRQTPGNDVPLSVTPVAANTTAPLPVPAVISSSSATDHCEADAPNPKAPEEFTLLANSQRHLTGHSVRAGASGEINIVEAALGYDGQCRPSPYQIYVFNNGKLVGTLSPNAMQARSDGAISGFKLVDPTHLQIDIEHYTPSDPACCASSHEQRIVPLSQFAADQPSAAASATSSPLPTPVAAQSNYSNVQTTDGPSFDCKKADSATDVMICADSTLSQLDAQMAHLYRQAVAHTSPNSLTTLKESQRAWLRERSQQCGADKACIENYLQTRIHALQQMPQDASSPSGVEPSQLEQGQLDAANLCFKNSNFDCSIQVAQTLLAQYPNDTRVKDLLQRSRDAQNAALHGNWNAH